MTEQRIARLRSRMRKHRLDALIVTAPHHIRYLTNFTGTNALCVIRRRSGILYTDTRYERQAAAEVRGVSCSITTSDLVETAAKRVAASRCSCLGFEAGSITYDQYKTLRKHARGVLLVQTTGFIEHLTQVKEVREIGFIKRAVSISEEMFEKVLDQIRPGVRELDISAEISYLHKRLGGDRDAFEPIVASGRRSALPHARASRKQIRRGDLVVLDFGCCVGGYHSDLTRTVAVGKSSEDARRMHAAVLRAQTKALESTHSCMPAKELDQIARSEIAAAGFGKYFLHSLGHGLGLQLHEPPKISPSSREELQAGSVVTIEPGVYVPTVGGVRIEDDVLITDRGCELLSHIGRELRIV